MAKEVTFDASQWVEWVYPRDRGDLTVFAPTRELAVIELRKNGYRVNPDKLIPHDRTLTDVLHKKGIV